MSGSYHCHKMLGFYIATISCLLYGVPGEPVSSCVDLDEQACILFAKAKPNLCTDPAFSTSTCKRFCGNCPLECYTCPTPVLNPIHCNTTSTCGAQQSCMTKHLLAADGHHEYVMSCEQKSLCEGLPFGFGGSGALIGKRDIMFDEETEDDGEIHGRERRDFSLSCCDTDFCNAPMTTTTMPPTSPGPFPHGCKRDIVFLIDASGSVGLTNFQNALGFISSIVEELDIGPYNALTSVVRFSTSAQIEWYLNTYPNKHQALQAISRIRYVGGTTHTDDAIHLVHTTVLTQDKGDRPDAENVVVVLTDGRSNDQRSTIHEASLLHQVSKDVISVEIGSSVGQAELNAISTDYHHIFDVRSYSNLHTILPQVMNYICNK